MSLPKRQDVGQYSLLYTLGVGSTGKVKLAEHRGTHKQYAMKIIKKSIFEDHPDLQDKTRREIALMRLMDHPHILKIIEILESQKHLYLVLEFASHGELFDYLASRGSLPIPDAMRLFRQIVYGLDYLHANSICHRDLKLENILLDEFNNVKIADFGFAKWMRSNVAETSCGSPHYAAPEVIKGTPYDGRKSDVWSCGVLMFVVFSRMYPFPDCDDIDFDEEIDFSPVPESVRGIVQRMMEKDPRKRPTMREVRESDVFACIRDKRPLEPAEVVDVESALEDLDVFLCSKVAQIVHTSYEECEELITSPGASLEKLVYKLLLSKHLDEQDAPAGSVPLRQSGSCPACVGTVGLKVQNFRARSCDVLDEIDKFMSSKNGCVSAPTINSRTIVVNGQQEDELIPFDCFDIKGYGCDLMINESPTADELVGFLVGKFGSEHTM